MPTHNFLRLFPSDCELFVGSASNVQIVDAGGVQERQRERVRNAALLTLPYDERAVEPTRANHRLGRLARHVAEVPRLASQLIQLHEEEEDLDQLQSVLQPYLPDKINLPYQLRTRSHNTSTTHQ